MNYLHRVLPYVRPYWKLAVVSVLLTIVASGAGLLSPWPLKIIVDHVLEAQALPASVAAALGWLAADRQMLLLLAVMMRLLVTLIENGVSVASSHVNTRLEQSMVLDIRSDLFQHAQRLSLAYHDGRRTGMLIFAINNQGTAAAGLIMTLQPLAQSVFTLVGMFWIAYQIHAGLALLSLAVVPFLYYTVGYYANHVVPRLQQVRGMEMESLSIVHEAFTMLRVIVAFGREDHEYGRFRKQGQQAVDARVQLTVRQTFFSLAVNMITAVGSTMVMGYGAFLVIQQQVTVGELLVLLAYIASIYQPLESIFYTFNTIQEHSVNLESIFKMLDRSPAITDAPHARRVQQCRGHLVFDRVDFSYQTRKDTLKQISFEARPGQKIGIVGQTGAGKTTLVSLIPRFYEATAGRILLDGQDVRDLTIRSLRDQVSLVLQEPLLFSGTIADNIRYGRLEATMDEIEEAARAANAHDFILRLPDQYETRLGERGTQISGGERQRICVARAFLKDAPILILDEPTSAIDSKTEAGILDALDRLMEGRTTFMIAHRLSTLRDPDLILVLQKGEIAERGTHAELLAGGTVYRTLYEAQTMPAPQKVNHVLPTLAQPSDVASRPRLEA